MDQAWTSCAVCHTRAICAGNQRSTTVTYEREHSDAPRSAFPLIACSAARPIFQAGHAGSIPPLLVPDRQ